MASRGNYRSKHYDELVAWFSTIPGRHVTVQEIHTHFLEQGTNIGMTTLYRLLSRLTDEGLVAKYTIDLASPACYEFIDHDPQHEDISNYHCKCEVCGKLIHLHCGEIDELQQHLLKEHHFSLNPKRTVMYGICEDCLRSQSGGDAGGNAGEDADGNANGVTGGNAGEREKGE